MRKCKHGHSAKASISPEYIAWENIVQRCCNPNNPKYPYYGGRGITICERWRVSFANFLADVGQRPSLAHTIERENGNGNYEAGNVTWATRKQQQRNLRSNRLITVNGITRTLAEWSEIAGLGRETIRVRLRANWPVEEAVSLPSMPRGLRNNKGGLAWRRQQQQSGS